MSFNHIHHTYPHPSPTPGTAQSYLVPPMDVDMDMDADLDQPKDQPTVDTIATSIQDFAVFPVASIPPGIQLASTRSRTRRASTVVPKSKTDANQRVVIAHAQSQFAVHAVRGLLKNADSTNANDGDDESVDVYAMVQDTESPEAREIKALGATLLQYDPTSSSSIRSALGQSGSSTLLLIPPQVDDTVIRTSSILSEARHSIKSILMWSTIGTDNAMDLPPEDDIDPQRQPGGSKAKADSRVPSALLLLKEAEELVMHVEGGIEYVVLRAGFPLQHFFLLSALIQNRGSIPFTSETAHMAPISLTDFGRATALLIHHTLTSGSLPDDFKNKTVLLTGPEPLSGPMIVTAANERLPHPLTFAKVGISDMRSFLLQTHASRFELSLAMGWWRLFMDGKLDVATGDLSDMLGGPDKLTKIREFFSKHVDRFLPTDGERAGAATFVHETYDEWDVMSRESSSGSEQGEGGGSPSKLAAKVLRDTAPHRSPKHAGIKKSTSAKCISDTHHTYFSAATACRHSPARKPTMSTKVLAEARRSPSVSPSSSCSLDPYVALALGIIDTFHAGLIEVMLSTTNQLRALNASMPADLQSEVAAAQVQTLIDRLAFMKDLVDACARDALRMAAPATTATAGNAPVQSGGMAAKVLGDIAGQHVCETCLKPARLVKKVIGDTERGSMVVETAGDEATTVASKVGVFAKVMHDVAEADVVEQPQQGSCVIQ